MIGRTTVRRPSLRELRAEPDEWVLAFAFKVWPELMFVSDERRREPYRTRDLERSKYALPHQGDRERGRRMIARVLAYQSVDWAEVNEIYARRLARFRSKQQQAVAA